MVGLLQNIYRASADKVFSKLMQLYQYERNVQPGGVIPVTYRSHTQQLLRRSEKEVRCTIVESNPFHASENNTQFQQLYSFFVIMLE